jgi:hypothetical protein
MQPQEEAQLAVQACPKPKLSSKLQVMSDADYDAIKQLLRKAGSIVTAEGPRCSLRSRSMYSDSQVDYLRMTALNVPAAVLVSD